jgi:phosphate:Na+ symporter
MKDFEIAIAALTSIILFIFGLESFSKELQKISGDSFRKALGKITKIPMIGVLLGAVITSIIQSSSATSVIAIGLVNAGVLSFKNSLGIILGANVGTTVTAQLIAFKLTNFAPYIIILGFILSFIKSKYSIFAKSLFYFGFVFFTLNLISNTLAPLKDDLRVVEFLTTSQGPMLGIFIGFLITAIVQSSSVTTGLAIIFTQQGLMSIDNAIPILMGANVGTTVTALFSIINMDIAAKKSAFAHLIFNIGGVVLFLPILYFNPEILKWGSKPEITLANFHLLFNLSTSIFFLILINPFEKLIHKVLGEGKMEFERIDFSFLSDKEMDYHEKIELIKEKETQLFDFIQENYSNITLSIESNYKTIYDVSKRRIEYVEFIKKDIMKNLAISINDINDDEGIQKYVDIITRFEYLFQIHDSVESHLEIKESLENAYIEISGDLLMYLRELTSNFLSFFEKAQDNLLHKKDKDLLKDDLGQLQIHLNNFHKNILKVMIQENRNDAAILFNIVTASQRLKDKIYTYFKLYIQT